MKEKKNKRWKNILISDKICKMQKKIIEIFLFKFNLNYCFVII